ncbi:Rtm1p [Apiospora arundinis]
MASNSNVPGPDAMFALYRYTPSLEAAIFGIGVFALVTIFHMWRMIRGRVFYFTPFVIGGVFEVIGYSGRVWSHFELNSVMGYTLQQLFILLAPALFAASIYMILGRLIRTLGAEEHSIIPLRFLTKIFVLGDVISFIAQGGGGGVQAAGTLELFHLGEKLMLVGLFIQIVFFGFFMVTTVVFHYRINTRPTKAAREEVIPWRRVMEYIQGNNGYIIRREYLLYIFETSLMFSVMFVLLVEYIGELNPGNVASLLEDVEETVSLTRFR